MPSRPRSRARLMLSSDAPGLVLRYRVNAWTGMHTEQTYQQAAEMHLKLQMLAVTSTLILHILHGGAKRAWLDTLLADVAADCSSAEDATTSRT